MRDAHSIYPIVTGPLSVSKTGYPRALPVLQNGGGWERVGMSGVVQAYTNIHLNVSFILTFPNKVGPSSQFALTTVDEKVMIRLVAGVDAREDREDVYNLPRVNAILEEWLTGIEVDEEPVNISRR